MTEAIPAKMIYNPNPGLQRRLDQGWQPFIYWDEGRWFVFAKRTFDTSDVTANLRTPQPSLNAGVTR